MKYIIECSKEDYSTYREQISKTLNKRMELYSRTKLSGVWRTIDGFDNTKKLSLEKLNQRKRRYRIYGIMFYVLGVIFILSGLLDPSELKSFIVYGLFLLLIGFVYMPFQKHKKGKVKELMKVMENLKSSNKKSAGLKLLFDSEGMYSQDKDLIMKTEDVDNVIITEDIFFFIHSNNLIPILKRDLVGVTVNVFEEFLVQLFQDKVCYVN
jgi:hypothetical protein